MKIRRLSPSDAKAVRELRLLGLRESPTSFGSSYEEESKFPLETFATRLQRSADKSVFGAFENDQLCGIVTLIRDDKKKQRHKAAIYGLYVDPNQRRKGVARQLLCRAIESAKKMRGLRQVRLAVTAGNTPAQELYIHFGFIEYGREEAALLIKGKYYSEQLLVLAL